MPFYENYLLRGGNVTRVGQGIIARELRNRLRLSLKLRGKTSLKTLELGPGKGYFARMVSELGWKYQAVDGSSSIVKSLKDAGFHVTEAFVPPIPEDVGDGYDLVLMEHFIEHMDSSLSARKLVESIHVLLADGGLIFIVAPDYLAHGTNFWDCDYTHAFVTTLQRLRQLLVDCGFEVRYTGYETLGIQGAFITWLISSLTHLAFATFLPQALSLFLKRSTDLSNKWKNVLLRSCIVVGVKNETLSR